MKITKVYFFFALLLMSCSKESYIGSGRIVMEERQVSTFDEISSEGVFKLSILYGDTQKVEIFADDNIIGKVRTDVSNGKLDLSLSDGNYKELYLEANITIPMLNRVENEGAGPVQIIGFEQLDDLTIWNSGSGNFNMEGKANQLKVTNEGSGNIDALNFETGIADIKSIGSGNVHVYCSHKLDVRIEGSGDVYYKGEPSITSHIIGSGKVLKHN